MDELFFSMLVYMYHFTPLVVGVADLVLAIIIFKAKTKTGVLGLIFASSFLISIMTFLKQTILPRALTAEMCSRYIAISNYAVFVLDLVAILGICIYIHKVYGKKWIYIPVYLIYIGGRLLLSAVTMLVNRAGVELLAIILITQFVSFIASGSAKAVVIVVFYKHRREEKIIPHMWIIWLSTLALSLVSCVLAAINQIALRGLERPNYDVLTIIDTLVMIWYLITTLADLIVPVYIVIRNSKFKREAVKAEIE